MKAPIAVEGHGTSLALNGLIEDILILGPPFAPSMEGGGKKHDMWQNRQKERPLPHSAHAAHTQQLPRRYSHIKGRYIFVTGTGNISETGLAP